ncbi:unnamed protein product [Strongylus vulgaris]|uniref:Uncharacterized protein n=1 Tax=Strongylus vulgaris TaxID=40348 RepID=A0A3P7KGW2_STRVU|nr:unnamed protein product [Strongylus vulgaris]
MRLFGNDTKIASVLLFDAFDRWSHLRNPDDFSGEIEQNLIALKHGMSKVVKTISRTASHLWLSSEDLERLSHFLMDFAADLSGAKNFLREDSYDKSKKLLDPFREPISKESYHGNQFQLNNATKESYLERFSAHIKLEQAPWLYVENYRELGKEPSSDTSAEQLIDSWEWQTNIHKSLERSMLEREQNPVRLIAHVVSTAEIAKMILESLKTVCSQGQNLVPITTFQYDLVAPILHSVHAKFIEKLGIDEIAMWSSVFGDYVTLFGDDEISRLHTHREWWVKCCRRMGLHPSLQVPFEESHSDTRHQLSALLTQIVVEACKFPVTNKHGSKQMIDAFAIRNVAIEEESRITEEARMSLSRMLAINTKLIHLLDKHPFKFIVFPTHQLPMTAKGDELQAAAIPACLEIVCLFR